MSQTRRFARRVRLARAWLGLGQGACLGAAVAGVWALLDWSRLAYADLAGLGLVVGVGAILGALSGFVRPLDPLALAKSLDRRAGLADRLATAVSATGTGFAEAQRGESEGCLTDKRPATLYPIRPTRWHGMALALGVVAIGLFLLGNSPLVRGPKTESERRELAEAGKAVRRVARPLLKQQSVDPQGKAAREAGKKLDRFAQELEQGKLNREDSLRKANDLADQAEKAAKDQAVQAKETLEKGETALAKWEKAKLAEAGLDQEDLERLKLGQAERELLARTMEEQGFESPPSRFSDRQLERLGLSPESERLANLSPEQAEALKDALAERQREIQREIDRIDALPPEQRAQEEAKRQELQRQMQEAENLSKALDLSDEARQALQELAQTPEAQKLREAMERLSQKASEASEGKPPTKEQIEQMRKAMQELAEQLKDPALREEVLQQMRDALEDMESGRMTMDAARQVLGAMGLGSQPGSADGEGGRGSQDVFPDTGMVNKSDNEMETKGKTKTTGVKGKWDDQGQEWTLEVKGPTKVGSRSSVPYRQVLPRYRQSAEKAISREQIPKDQERRVREYFDALGVGK